jgi:hypothetical protein
MKLGRPVELNDYDNGLLELLMRGIEFINSFALESGYLVRY